MICWIKAFLVVLGIIVGGVIIAGSITWVLNWLEEEHPILHGIILITIVLLLFGALVFIFHGELCK